MLCFGFKKERGQGGLKLCVYVCIFQKTVIKKGGVMNIESILAARVLCASLVVGMGFGFATMQAEGPTSEELSSLCENIMSGVEQDFPCAIKAAVEGMGKEETQNEALKVFGGLVYQRQAYSEALDAAKSGMENEATQNSALIVFEVLVYQRQAYSVALDAAKSGMEDGATQKAALDVFIALVYQGKSYPEALDAVVKGMERKNNTDRDVLESALELLRFLVANYAPEFFKLYKRPPIPNDFFDSYKEYWICEVLRQEDELKFLNGVLNAIEIGRNWVVANEYKASRFIGWFIQSIMDNVKQLGEEEASLKVYQQSRIIRKIEHQ